MVIFVGVGNKIRSWRLMGAGNPSPGLDDFLMKRSRIERGPLSMAKPTRREPSLLAPGACAWHTGLARWDVLRQRNRSSSPRGAGSSCACALGTKVGDRGGSKDVCLQGLEG